MRANDSRPDYAVVDLRGTISYISDAYASTLGRRSFDLVGHDFREFMPAGFCSDGVDCFDEFVAREESVVIRADCVLPDGGVLAMDVSMMLVRDEHGTARTVLVVPRAAGVVPGRPHYGEASMGQRGGSSLEVDR